MFNNRSTYNNGNTVNLNTRLYTSYSDTAMVVLGAWNSQLSLKVHPLKNVTADGIRQYAQDNTEIINTSITVDNAHALIEAIENELQPAIDSKISGSVTIEMGLDTNKKTLSIKTDGTDIELEIAVNVDSNGVAAEGNIISHKFNKRKYMVNYNPRTGEGEIKEAHSEYDAFVAKIRSIDNLAPVIAHSINYNNMIKDSYRTRNTNQNMFSNNGAGGFVNNSSANNVGYNAPTSNFTGADMSGFLPMS